MKKAIIKVVGKFAEIKCPTCEHSRRFGRGYLKSPVRHIHCPRCFLSMRLDQEAIDLALKQIGAYRKG